MSYIYNSTKRITAIIFFLLILCATNTAYSDSLLSIHFIDVGDGDSTLILLHSGENILIDVGSPSAGPRVAQYLKSVGIKEINHLILTHSHYDHIGGIFSILSKFDVLNYYDNGFSNFGSDIYRDYIKLVRKDLSKYKILQAGESLRFNDIRIEVLNPLLPPTGNINTDSIVLKVIYGEVKILLAGDMGQLGERRFLNLKTDLRSQILKVAHHGEDDSTSDDFLKSIKPEEAIISISEVDIYARPHPAVINRLKQAGTRIHRTDLNGNIVLRTDGKTYSIETEKQ
ncbi:MAG: MBL fold metallo-hydrolase [Thermodesulfovibrionia bacterium]|nr:MBL fold metallo-hydrolase [Thermodesulfovibrionia bacterium]